MYQDDVKKYFKDKAAEYDLVEKQSYWRLSDKLLWDSIVRYIIPKLPADFSFCDAGGGTGRWSLKLLENYSACSGVTLDLSPEMLNEAIQKKEKNKLNDRWKCELGDLEDLTDFAKQHQPFDFVFNFHNVIGFISDPKHFMAELSKITKKGGIVCTFAPNAYHATFFNIKNGAMDEAEKALKGYGRFTDQMPYIHMFTPHRIKKLMEESDFEVLMCTGFPSLIYPGYSETQLRGQTKALSDLLEDENIFNQIFDLEKEALKDEEIAARGNNIFIFARKK